MTQKIFLYFFLKNTRSHEQFDTLHLKIRQKLSSQWIFEKKKHFHTFYRFLWFFNEKSFFTENAAIESVFIRFWRVRSHFLGKILHYSNFIIVGGLGIRGVHKKPKICDFFSVFWKNVNFWLFFGLFLTQKIFFLFFFWKVEGLTSNLIPYIWR